MSTKLWVTVLIGAAILASCQRAAAEGEHAEEQYNIVDRNGGSLDEKCRAAREVAAAYLRDRNEEKYRSWHIHAEADCSSAALQL
jgi:hypothetical protein